VSCWTCAPAWQCPPGRGIDHLPQCALHIFPQVCFSQLFSWYYCHKNHATKCLPLLSLQWHDMNINEGKNDSNMI
jgi:hypothetical protein